MQLATTEFRTTPAAWLTPDLPGAPSSTNQGSASVPFQRWYRFKEAFSPRFVLDAIDMAKGRVSTIADPFGGSGTTSLTAQFSGIEPTTVEVNPFLADLIESKLSSHCPDELEKHVLAVVRHASRNSRPTGAAFPFGPPTLVEPGVGGKWVFDSAAADRIGVVREGIEAVPCEASRRFLRVILASCLVSASNVTISGKGRRYRQRWNERPRDASAILPSFEAAAGRAVEDVRRAGDRPCRKFTLLRGDAREEAGRVGPVDMALFSPPYPNSFDYHDVYNLELLCLGYVLSKEQDRSMRMSTLRSHVQIGRDHPPPSVASPLLDGVASRLADAKASLWHPQIPDMVLGYFGDMERVLSGLAGSVNPGGSVIMVAGDSRYAGIHVPVVAILSEIADAMGFRVEDRVSVRNMRSSPQQGGRHELAEELLHLVVRK